MKLYLVVHKETGQVQYRPKASTAIGYTKKGYATSRANALDIVWTKEYNGDGRFIRYNKTMNDPRKYGVKEVELDVDSAVWVD
jgi:hypothetical protein